MTQASADSLAGTQSSYDLIERTVKLQPELAEVSPAVLSAFHIQKMLARRRREGEEEKQTRPGKICFDVGFASDLVCGLHLSG